MFIVTGNEYVNFNIKSDSLCINIEEQCVSIILTRQNGIHINIFNTSIGDVDENVKICKNLIENIIFNNERLYIIGEQFDYYKEEFNKVKKGAKNVNKIQ